MSQRAALVAIAVGWTLAAVTIFLAGAWYADVHRYDGCDVIVGERIIYICAEDRPPPPRGERV